MIAAGQIDAIDVQELYFDAVRNGERYIVALALEALDGGITSDAWKRCASILLSDGRLTRRHQTIPYRLTDPPVPYRLVAS